MTPTPTTAQAEAATASDSERLGVVMPRIVRLLAWRELALRFLDAHNPQPYRAIVVAHAILDWDGELGFNIRNHAHHFTTMAVRIIDGPDQAETPEMTDLEKWLIRWRAEQMGY